jgi:hypothetical protein
MIKLKRYIYTYIVCLVITILISTYESEKKAIVSEVVFGGKTLQINTDNHTLYVRQYSAQHTSRITEE